MNHIPKTGYPPVVAVVKAPKHTNTKTTPSSCIDRHLPPIPPAPPAPPLALLIHHHRSMPHLPRQYRRRKEQDDIQDRETPGALEHHALLCDGELTRVGAEAAFGGGQSLSGPLHAVRSADPRSEQYHAGDQGAEPADVDYGEVDGCPAHSAVH